MEDTHILIVEDESIVALDLKKRLSSMGYPYTLHAMTGEDAIRLAKQDTPDLLLMDIRIKGGLDGIMTAQIIKSRIDVPVIYITAYADEPTLNRAKITGPSGYILKPFQEHELAIAIEMALYKHKMDKALRESEERYTLAIMGANDGIWDWDLKKNKMYFSPHCMEIIGYQDEMEPANIDEWLQCVHPDDRDALQLAISHHIEGLTDHIEYEHRMIHKDGSLRWIRMRGQAIFDEDHHTNRVAGSISDITPLKQAQEQLLHDAFHDVLTGLPNRALFLDRLNNAIERHKRHKEQAFSVLFLDLDQFKVVNDSLGHLVGDNLLVQVANRLQDLLRASDTVARFGGDEFVILLESAGSVPIAKNAAERVEEVIKVPIQLDGHQVSITASMGIVLVTSEHQDANDVLRDADIALYRAKSMGKNRHEIFDIQHRRLAMERLEIVNYLTHALERGELHLNYQPIYSLENRQIVGLEALLRLKPEGHDLIPPNVFIPIAEEIGMMEKIGDWVLLQSCMQMSEWCKLFPREQSLNLHVNMSVKQFNNPNLVERIQEILALSQLEPTKLNLEITENIFIENYERITVMLENLSLLGIHIIIDDFGTGYSSLGYIQRFPITTVKLDRQFIGPLKKHGKNGVLIKDVINLANHLGLETIAEGIETEEQEDSLIKMKCRFGQGFLFSKPMETQFLEELLKNNLIIEDTVV